MDQLKVFLKQCVKYRFWIAFGVSVLLPIIGYFAGVGAINGVTTAREGEINSANTEVAKYTTPGIVNNQYQPLAAAKKDLLVQDVDATWRKLFASQEPLLKWPASVQDRFLKWGRKYPTDVDKGQVQSTLIDYAVAYPEFVENIYKVFKPFNFDDGTGIVVAPDSKVLLAPAVFSQDNPPELSKVWAEQERLWVVTALLDAIAKINDGAGAKEWDRAIVKQINLLEVGAATDQDQKSMAKGDILEPADTLSADGTTAAAPPPAAPAPGGDMAGMMGGMMGGIGSGMGGGKATNEVLYIKTGSQQFKALPIKLTVLVDQATLPNYLVGLENSPMAIEVNEVEFAKPLAPVTKPVYGEKSSVNFGMMGMGGQGGRGGEEMMMGGGGGSAMGRAMQGGMGRGGAAGGGNNMADMMMGMGGRGGSGGAAKANQGGIDNRSVNAAKARKDKEKKDQDAAKKGKTDTKKIDQYYNVIEVTVYGRARFYLAPPPLAVAAPSTAATPPAASPSPTPDATKGETPQASTPPAEAPKKDEAPKSEAEAPKADAPKTEGPKGETSAPKL